MILHRKEQKNASIVEKTIFHKDSFYRKIMVIFSSFMLLISSGSVHKVNAEPLTGATVATIVLTVGVIGGVGSVGFYLFEQWTDGKAPTIEGLISNFTWGVALASASALALLLAPIASSSALATVLSVSGTTLATVEGRTSAISAYLAEKTEPVVELAVNRYVTKHSLGYISIDDLNNVIAHLDGKIRNGLYRELEECVDETAPPEDVGNFDFSGLYVRDMSFANGQSVHPDDQLNLTLIFEDHNGMGVGSAVATVVLQPKVAEDYDPATLLVSSALKPLTPTGKYSLDIKLPADLPVGSYNLYISFKDPATGLILSNAESAGQSSPYAISINVENDCPVAVISSNASSVNVGSSVTLDAADSYDPNGDSITYQWTLQAQDKSMSNLTSTTGLSTDFTPDLPGSYTIVLRVSDGKSNAESKIIIKAEKTYDLSPIQLEPEKITGPISGEASSERYYPIQITASQNVARLDISLLGYSKANRDADIYVSYNKKPSVKLVEYYNGNTIPEIDADYEDSDHNQKDEHIEIPNPEPGTYWVLLYGYMSAYSEVDLYYQINTGVNDSDGDGVPDGQDEFPNDKNEAYDSDDDGVGDNADVSPNDSKRWDNVKPVIEPLSDQVVNIGEKKVIALSITDADGDDIIVALLKAPDFMELSEQTLIISPKSGDEGDYTVIIEVQDDFGGSTWNNFVVNAVMSASPIIDQTITRISVPTTSSTGNYTVSWSNSSTDGVTYVLEEATNSDFTSNLRTAYTGTETSASITRRSSENTYHYRVKATKSGHADSDWKTGANGCRILQDPVFLPNYPNIGYEPAMQAIAINPLVDDVWTDQILISFGPDPKVYGHIGISYRPFDDLYFSFVGTVIQETFQMNSPPGDPFVLNRLDNVRDYDQILYFPDGEAINGVEGIRFFTPEWDVSKKKTTLYIQPVVGNESIPVILSDTSSDGGIPLDSVYISILNYITDGWINFDEALNEEKSCTYSIVPEQAGFSEEGGTSSVLISSSRPDCAWTTSENLSWVSMSPESGALDSSGQASVAVAVDPNEGEARTGSVLIADQIFTITQAGISSTLNKNNIVLTHESDIAKVSPGDDVRLYGTASAQQIILERGGKAELINFPGHNTIQVVSAAGLFMVSRSGSIVVFNGSDGTELKIPATRSVQTIKFSDRMPMTLLIHNNKVMLDDQVISIVPALITGGYGTAFLHIENAGFENGTKGWFSGFTAGTDCLFTVDSDAFEGNKSAKISLANQGFCHISNENPISVDQSGEYVLNVYAKSNGDSANYLYLAVWKTEDPSLFPDTLVWSERIDKQYNNTGTEYQLYQKNMTLSAGDYIRLEFGMDNASPTESGYVLFDKIEISTFDDSGSESDQTGNVITGVLKE